ncbi:MAG: hypothetical protein HY424_01745 [Candidatus Levybacteria bacterium]|nr:hypothetical protein [Candidatus Levybacteria bacterium]
MDIKALKQFLIKAKKGGYAAGNQIKESDDSYSTRFEEEDFKFHDNWFGGEPFGGREVVWFKNKPFWMMVYYGEEFAHDEKAIPTLRKALSQMLDDFPARGPKIFKDGEFTYKNNWIGSIEKFSGEESISKNRKIVYNAKYAGGLVDQYED